MSIEYEEKKHKSFSLPLIIGIVCCIVVLGTVCAVILVSNNKKDNDRVKPVSQVRSVSTTEINEVESEDAEKNEDSYVENIDIEGNMQYDLNIFMSNFSESDLSNFSMDKRLSAEELTMFARSYCILNRPELYEYSDREFEKMYCNIRISQKNVEDIVMKYFNISLDKSEFNENMMYHDGYFYSQVTGGDMSSGCTVVKKIEKLGHNTYELHCDVYFTDGDDDSYYSFNAQQAEEECKKEDVVFLKTKSGTAIIEADDINDRSTYILKEYHMKNV